MTSAESGPHRGFHHIAYWVDDLETARKQATALLGVGPFKTIDHVDLGEFRFDGEPAVLDHSASFTQWGPVILELNQVHHVEPESLRGALGISNGAVSHTSWFTDDLAAETEHLVGSGCALLTTSVGGAVANWFSGGSLFAHPIEIHEPTPPVAAMWASLPEGSIYGASIEERRES
ncbi:hypothetical protein BH09ACT1_BH09ACT1_09830 [soil metagenome]